MTGHIEAHNVSQALRFGLDHLSIHGIWEDSRCGRVIRSPTPVLTTYHHPCQRVLFSPIRDANPFFHFYEALWMLDGREEVGDLIPYVSRIANFSDDGTTLHGAYGYRWLSEFRVNQLHWAVNTLRSDPSSRRCVISMWDPDIDCAAVSRDGKDVPCNTHLYPWVDHGALHLTICCRSNDIIWGAYGANAVHFSILQEYLACALGVQVGKMYQLSNNFHAYEAEYNRCLPLLTHEAGTTYYPGISIPLFNNGKPTGREEFDAELKSFLSGESWSSPFFAQVAEPIVTAHKLYRKGEAEAAIELLDTMARDAAPDWTMACIAWLRRHSKTSTASA